MTQRPTLADALAGFAALPLPVKLALAALMAVPAFAITAVTYGPVTAAVGTLAALAVAGLTYDAGRDITLPRRPSRLLAHLFNYRRPSLRGMAYAALALAAGVVAQIAIVLAWLRVVPAGTESAQHTYSAASAAEPTTLALAVMVAAAVVAGPILEELLFRNGIQRLLTRRFGPAVGIAVASAAFAVMHVPSYGGWGAPVVALAPPILSVFASAVAYGILFWRTNNVVLPILAHAGYNALALGFALGVLP